MIHNETFSATDKSIIHAKDSVMKKVNMLVIENKIQRSNILEFRTKEEHGPYGSDNNLFEVTISWWK